MWKWPAAFGFLLGVAAVVGLTLTRPPGGVALSTGGMAAVFLVALAVGTLIGVLFSKRKPPNRDEGES